MNGKDDLEDGLDTFAARCYVFRLAWDAFVLALGASLGFDRLVALVTRLARRGDD